MTILYTGELVTTATSYNKFAGYTSPSPLANTFAGASATPAGELDRLALVASPTNSSDTVLRAYLTGTDPTGSYSASALRSQVAHLMSSTEDDLQKSYWYWFRYYLPDNWIIADDEISQVILECHDTPDTGNTFTADATANELTFGASVIWPDTNRIRFSTTGTLPAPLVAGTTYYVKNGGGTNVIQVATTSGGSAIDITSAGSGTHTALDPARSPPLTVEVLGRQIVFKNANENQVSKRILTAHVIALGSWESVVINARWDWTSSGFMKIWRNRRLIFAETGINAYNDDPTRGGLGVYPLMGLYAPVGWPASNPASRTAYFKGVVVGDTYTTFDEFMAAAGSSDTELEGFAVPGVSL